MARSRYASFGDSEGARFLNPSDQKASLEVLAQLTLRASVNPLVRSCALKIVRDCDSREDQCELQAIYNAVKYGDPDVAPFKRPFKYVADARYADYFASPVDAINACLKGACGGDCDDHTSLVAALAASIGWRVGLRAWGRKGDDAYSHVYAVVAYPKRPPHQRAVALDTTVPEFSAGDEPPRGEVLTAWLT